MWHMALMTLGLLAVAVVCEEEVLIAKPSAGDYEIVALVAE